MQAGSVIVRSVALLFAVLTTVTAFQDARAQQAIPLHVEGPASPAPWARYRDWSKTTWDKYNTLAQRERTPKALGKPLDIAVPITGDANKGRDLAFSRARGGGCLACHVMGPQSLEAPGNAGPDLSEIGAAGRPDEYLFNYIWDARHLNPDSAMPPWGAHGFYTREEVIDMVAFLKTLRTPATFRNRLDDPEKRPLPVEDRDALDPFVNPAADRIGTGAELFAKAGPSGKSCASCHADSKAFAGWAVRMPKWNAQAAKMIGVEEFIFRHAKATTGAEHLMQGRENTDLSIFLHSLSNGRPIEVDLTSPDAKRVYEFGKALYDAKIGQFNFSCGDCHAVSKGGNKWLRGQYVGDGKGQMDHFPLWRTSRGAGEVWDIRKRLQWCNVQVRANELPPDAAEYDALELYLKSLSQGMPLTAPNIRH